MKSMEKKFVLLKMESYLKEKIGAVIKLDPKKVDSEEYLDLYGVDSVVIMDVTRQLEKEFGPLSKSLFFEYKTIKELSNYFYDQHKETLEKLFDQQAGNKVKELENVSEWKETAKMTRKEVSSSSETTIKGNKLQKYLSHTAKKTITELEQKELSDEIAIIGLSGEYPMAPDLDIFWNNLKEGKDCITEIPKERKWDLSHVQPGLKEEAGAVYTKWGSFLDDYCCFDSSFYHISPREAKMMDPQERRFLETVWHVMEDAGYMKKTYSKSKIGVFVGVMYSEYQMLGNGLTDGKNGVPVSNHSSIANRVSYQFDFKGPSIAVDTMCSSSMTAIYLAVKSILNGDCDMAVAGGVNLSLTPYKYLVLSHGKFASSDGKCRSFGEGGDGYVPGEGVGAVLLKPLKQAVQDGDHIYGTIKGMAINHNGRTNGYSVPDPVAQSEVIKKALSQANISSDHVSYVEAHGTGTALGDPIEINGLVRAFDKDKRSTHCAIGSVKSNIGHLESAAGMAALTKVLLQMKYKTIVTSLHSETLNKNIDFTKTPFEVQKENMSWNPVSINSTGAKKEIPRIAGISAFGAGGSNAHMIVSEYINKDTKVSKKDEPFIFILSAQNEERLKEYIEAMYKYVTNTENQTMSDDSEQKAKITDMVAGFVKKLLQIEHDDLIMNETLNELGMDQYSINKLDGFIHEEFPQFHENGYGIGTHTLNSLIDEISCVERVDGTAATLDEDDSFWQMIYTLQIGREAMDERIAITASSKHELVHALFNCINAWGKEDAREGVRIFHGNKLKDQTGLTDLLDAGSIDDMVVHWKEQGNLDKIAAIWAKGFDIDFADLFDYHDMNKISLPVYPFLKKSYWFEVPVEEKVYREQQVIGKEPQIEHSSDETSVDVQTIEELLVEPELSETVYEVEEIEQVVSNILSETLEISNEDFDQEQAFTEFGIDSVLSVELINKINEELNIELNSTDLFNYPTIRALSEYIMEKNPINKKYTTAKQNKSTVAPVSETRISNAVSQNNYNKDKIAIIGMSARMPEADTLDEFWNNLSHGICSVGEVERWRDLDYYSMDKTDPNRSYCKNMGCMNQIAGFEPLFFSISPKEAQMMDPQQRILLMEAWKALEDAGYCNKELEKKKVGVFIGCGSSDYADGMKEKKIQPEAYAFMGNDMSILASRLSYYMNLRGPSMAVNTACSSSLVAIHLACESIWSGTSDMVLAGGVAVLTTPNLHIMASRAGMLSETGYCKTFDQSADGFVPGEGAGIVILKKYEDAVRDHDHIYAVIDGIKINQDGKTNGITAPSGPAQTELEAEIYRENAIFPETITYIETHGTGTKLGDPIEINALKDSFAQFTKKKGYCALGSVKSNIGHTLTAAGIASLIKVLLCIRHKKLVPTVHMKELNEHIQLDDTPFYVGTKLADWEAGEALVRRAAISSFGFSGTNAHMVLSEVKDTTPTLEDNNVPVMIVLSARTKWSLRQKTTQLLQWAKQHKGEYRLSDVAYTLLNGRSHFEHRKAMIVTNWEDMMEALQTNAEYTGFVENFQKKRVIVDEIEDRIEQINADYDVTSNLKALASYYIEGYEEFIRDLYVGKDRYRIALPVYPFELQNYWYEEIPEYEKKPFHKAEVKTDLQVPYDLCMEKEFDYYVKTLHVSDPVLRDHVVNNMHVLPGVAYLDMIYTTLKSEYPNECVSLEQVVWLRPLVVTMEKKIKLTIIKHGMKQMFTLSDATDETDIYAKGYISTSDRLEETIAVEQVQNRCMDTLNGTDIYQGLVETGLEYGTFFRSIQSISSNQGEALGRLSLLKEARNLGNYYLCPGIMDAALQTITGIKYSKGEKDKSLYLPFSVGQLSVYHKVDYDCYAYVQEIGTNLYKIQLLDQAGRVLAILDHVYLRLVETKKTIDFCYLPMWNKINQNCFSTLQKRQGKTLIFYRESQRDILSCFDNKENTIFAMEAAKTEQISERQWRVKLDDQEDMNQLISYYDGDLTNIYYFTGMMAEDDRMNYESILVNEKTSVLSFFRVLQALKGNYRKKKLRIVVITGDTFHVLDHDKVCLGGASLQGLTKSVAKEFTTWEMLYVDVARKDLMESQSCEKTISLIDHIPAKPSGDELTIRYGNVYERNIVPVELKDEATVKIKQHGVYVILGGAGGIGTEFAKYLSKNYQATAVLIGRSSLDEKKEQKIKEISSLGGKAIYVQADASNDQSMKVAADQIVSRFGKINGVIHSAIVLRDKLIENMTEEMFSQALDPKLAGTINLYHAFEKQPLDFFLFFSSAQSFSGNAGQSNYAAGCTFCDAFASYMQKNSEIQMKVINWGYWGSVGIVSNDYYNEALAKQGVVSIRVEEGMEIVERMLNSSLEQIIPFKINDDVKEQMNIDRHQWLAENTKNEECNFHAIKDDNKEPKIDEEEVNELVRSFDQLRIFGEDMLEKVFAELNILSQVDRKQSMQEICKEAGIEPQYNRLFAALLDIMIQKGSVRCENGLYYRIKMETVASWSKFGQREIDLMHKNPQVKYHAELLYLCCSKYTEILTGKVLPTDIMFPNSSMKLVEGIYKGNNMADYYNHIVAWSISSYVKHAISNGVDKVRIVEVGAGTGGTSGAVLEAIYEYREHVEYVYTDISVGFTKYGQQTFSKKHNYIKFGLLNIEEEIKPQNYQKGEFDLLIATNVLHATKNMDVTLNHAKELLKTNGWIVVNEATAYSDFSTMTFGLLDGWWLYEDVENRIPHAPLLSPAKWEEILSNHGFKDVTILGDSNSGQNVILAASNGLIWEEKGESSSIGSTTTRTLEQPAVNDQNEKEESFVGVELQTTNNATADDKTITTTENEKYSNETVNGKTCVTTGNDKNKLKEIIKVIQDGLQKTLGVKEDELSNEKSFSSYGVDSISGVDLVNYINDQLDIVLNTTVIFDYVSVKQLAHHIYEEYKDSIHHLDQDLSIVDQDISIGEETVDQEVDTNADILKQLENGDISVDEAMKFWR